MTIRARQGGGGFAAKLKRKRNRLDGHERNGATGEMVRVAVGWMGQHWWGIVP